MAQRISTTVKAGRSPSGELCVTGGGKFAEEEDWRGGYAVLLRQRSQEGGARVEIDPDQ